MFVKAFLEATTKKITSPFSSDFCMSPGSRSPTNQRDPKYSVFNGFLLVKKSLGEGKTARVYLGESIKDPK